MQMTETTSGLKMATLLEGHGEQPKVGDTVLIHYEIWVGEGVTSSNYDYEKEAYIDQIYDSTYNEGPYSGPVEIIIGDATPKDEIYTRGESIAGLDEALLQMKVGGKVALDIPPHLAYGEEGASSFHTFHGYRTPPTKNLRCNIELMEVRAGLETKDTVADSGPAYEAV
jgi:FKBP-type peptidyl-prolyl cis-trans isomerase 2